MKLSKSKLALLLILGLAFVLRAQNPTFGSPSLYYSNDEAIAHLSALNMLATTSAISIANYAPLGAYLQLPIIGIVYIFWNIFGVTGNPSDFEKILTTREGILLFVPRIISILFGTLSVIGMYKFSFAVFKDKKVAVIAAFLMATSFSFVHISTTGRPWSVAIYLLIYFLAYVITGRNIKSTVFVVFSYFAHQIAIFVIPLWLLLFKGSKRTLAINLAFFAISAYLINNLSASENLVSSVLDGQSIFKTEGVLQDMLGGRFSVASLIHMFGSNLSMNFLSTMILCDPVIVIGGILGLVNQRKVKLSRFLLLFAASYFIFASLFFHLVTRYLLILLILMIPYCAFLLSKVRSKLILVSLLFLASINSGYWSYLLNKSSTIELANEWVNQTIKNDSFVYTGGRYQAFVPSFGEIGVLRSVNQNAYLRLEKYQLEADENTIKNVIYSPFYPGDSKMEKFRSSSQDRDVRYVVDYYYKDADSLYLNNREFFLPLVTFDPRRVNSVEVPEFYFEAGYNFDPYNVVPKTSMYTISRPGPVVQVLAVK